MKAIIIAAGRGLRLSPLTNDRPKCMLELNGRTLLEHQIDSLRGAGIEKIAVVKGYKKETINYPGLVYYVNDDYLNNNILLSLFYAEEEMDGAFIAVYSDIIYEKEIVDKLVADNHDISIVVDTKWRRLYENRRAHPLQEAENVIFDENNNLVEIGKIVSDKSMAHGEFIGMMRCSSKGSAIFKDHFSRLKKEYSQRPFQKADIFENAYLTDMLQELVDRGISVHCVNIESGWREIDTLEDYENIKAEFSRIKRGNSLIR
jgi:choline kinase